MKTKPIPLIYHSDCKPVTAYLMSNPKRVQLEIIITYPILFTKKYEPDLYPLYSTRLPTKLFAFPMSVHWASLTYSHMVDSSFRELSLPAFFSTL